MTQLDPDPLHPPDDPPREYVVTSKLLLKVGGPIATFGVRLWANRWLRRGASIVETVDFESGNYVYRAVDPRVPRHDPPPPGSTFLGCWTLAATAAMIAIALLLVAAPRLSSEPSAVPATIGAPLGTSRTNPMSSDPLDGSRLGAGAEGRSPAGGAPQPAVVHAASEPIASTPAPTPTPEPTGGVGDGARGGYAVWHDNPRQPAGARYAAAGPGIREWLGSDWRGQVVRVTYAGRSTLVPLSDWCACGDRVGLPTLIDLSTEAWLDLAPLSAGVIEVDIVMVGLPATEVVE